MSFAAEAIDPTAVLLQVTIIFAAAKVFGEIAVRLGGVALIGEIAAGAILGPHAFGLIREDEIVVGLAEFGVVILLFSVGLEMDFKQLRRTGARGIFVGTVGIVLPFIAGAAISVVSGHSTPTAMFLGAAMVATSVGITARVLSDLGLLRETEAVIILAAAVADDVLGLLVLAAVTAMSQNALDPVRLGILLAETLVFIAILLTAGRIAVRQHGHRVQYLRIPQGALSFALIVCLLSALLAGIIGLAAIVGAYLAGLLVAELSGDLDRELKRDMEPIRALLVPFFFVLTGARFDFRAFFEPSALALGAVITVFAILTKLVGCGLAMWGTSLRSAVRVGVGMVPRGEVGLVVAALGLTAGLLDGALYGAVLMMVAITTLVAPFMIGPAFAFRSRMPRRRVHPATAPE